MAQEYVPKDVKATDYKDKYGNPGFNVIYSNGERALHVAKFPPEVGKPEYGEIIDAEKRNGGTYKKFKRVQKEEGYVPSTVSQAPQPQASNLEQRIEQLEKDVAFLKEMTVPSVTPSKTSQNGSGGLSGVSVDDYLSDDIPF